MDTGVSGSGRLEFRGLEVGGEGDWLEEGLDGAIMLTLFCYILFLPRLFYPMLCS
jgi:hypothetical protein